MNWFRRLYLKRQYDKLVKEKNPEFMKFKQDYEHTPLDEFYKNGERTFSRKELEYWKLIDVKNNNKVSEELKEIQNFNKNLEKNIVLGRLGKVQIGSITINQDDKLFEVPLAIDKRTNDLYFDIKQDKKETSRTENITYNWKPYNSKFVNFAIYEKIKNNKPEQSTIDIKNVSVLASNDQYNLIIDEIKGSIKKGVNKLSELHTNDIIKHQKPLAIKIEELQKENKELEKENTILVKNGTKEQTKEQQQKNEKSLAIG